MGDIPYCHTKSCTSVPCVCLLLCKVYIAALHLLLLRLHC